MNKTSILIPTRFNNRWPLELTFQTIRKYTKDCPYEMIVGDAGMEPEALEYVRAQKDVQICPCPDPIRPKDTLARFAQSPYLLFVHDDIQVFKDGWLKRRIDLMESDERVGVVGEMSHNYLVGWRWKKYFTFSPIHKRFFPLGMLVRKKMQDHLELKWGIERGFDTGGIAYLQFIKQKDWKYKKYLFSQDIKHWGQMTWVMKERKYTTLNIKELRDDRQQKIDLIKDILANNKY